MVHLGVPERCYAFLTLAMQFFSICYYVILFLVAQGCTLKVYGPHSFRA